MKTCGVAGIGNLGEALTNQLDKAGIHVHAYHPKSERRSEFSKEFKEVKPVDFSELLKQSIIFLVIPAEAIRPFLEKAQKEIRLNNLQPIFVSLSTLVNTKELQNDFPELQIYGVKMVGHANYLYEHGDGVFITETPLDEEGFQEARVLIEKVGTLYKDNENLVREINGLAVRKIIEACVNFEKEAEIYPEVYRKKALNTIFPNTTKLYIEGTIDGFIQQIIDEMSAENNE